MITNPIYIQLKTISKSESKIANVLRIVIISNINRLINLTCW